MSATRQLRHRSIANQRHSTFSAWAMSIVFAAIAAISFAVDQTVVSTLISGGELRQSFGEFSPIRLLQSLVDITCDQSNRAE